MRKKIAIAFIVFILTSVTAFAHQPRIPEGEEVVVEDPEISKAYYAELTGNPHSYSISSNTTFNLYVNILVPAIEGQKKDISAVILKDNNTDNPIAILDGPNFEWTQFYEPFGNDLYWMGPEYESKVEPGEYKVIVSSPNNDSKYSLATGKLEKFDFKEIRNALKLIPKIKRDFFEESPANFLFSPFGWGLVLIMFLLSFIFGFIYRALLTRFAKKKARKAKKNIGRNDRILRFVISIFLFILAISTSWSPILLFLSGFTLFEAIFSWCGFYAAIGKS